MRTSIAFLAGAAIGAASAIALTDRAMRELIHEGHLAVIGDEEGESLDRREPHHDVDGKGGIVMTFDPPHPPPGFNPAMLAEAWQAGREGRRL